MEIYLELNGNEILNVFTENIDENLKVISINHIDDFYNITQNKYSFSEEIEEKVKEIIEIDENSESLNMFNIKHWVSNRSFGELIDMFEVGEIIKPDMQREFVWDSVKCSRLIESIILGLPIPPLFLLEVGKNKYELIDGLQRMTTLYNYVKGNPWHGSVDRKRKVSSKLSTKVSKEIQGKTFEKLDIEHQRALKRSTIPLIEFKQLEPDNISSKYLIFERINTGSEKLNPMQIRKSLAHGLFIKDLYNFANSNKKFLAFFNATQIKKDNHVEALLRVCLINEIKNQQFDITKNGMSNILNDYCEKRRNTEISNNIKLKIKNALEKALEIFEKHDNSFRRVEKDISGNYIFSGNLNTSIMEAFLSELMDSSFETANVESIRKSYKVTMHSLLEKSLKKELLNPFTTSTGSPSSIKKRIEICKNIMESADENI